MAASTRESLLQMVAKYHSPGAVSRAFEMAWTRAQLEFRFLRINAGAAHRFQELASQLIYPSARLRPPEVVPTVCFATVWGRKACGPMASPGICRCWWSLCPMRVTCRSSGRCSWRMPTGACGDSVRTSSSSTREGLTGADTVANQIPQANRGARFGCGNGSARRGLPAGLAFDSRRASDFDPGVSRYCARRQPGISPAAARGHGRRASSAPVCASRRRWGRAVAAAAISRTAILQRAMGSQPGFTPDGRRIRDLPEAGRNYSRTLGQRDGKRQLRRYGWRKRPRLHLVRQQPDEPAHSMAQRPGLRSTIGSDLPARRRKRSSLDAYRTAKARERCLPGPAWPGLHGLRAQQPLHRSGTDCFRACRQRWQ